jgi:hypothetical protein
VIAFSVRGYAAIELGDPENIENDTKITFV